MSIKRRLEQLEKRCKAVHRNLAVIFIGREDEAAQRAKALAVDVFASCSFL